MIEMLEVTSAMICCAEDVGELERQSVYVVVSTILPSYIGEYRSRRALPRTKESERYANRTKKSPNTARVKQKSSGADVPVTYCDRAPQLFDRPGTDIIRTIRRSDMQDFELKSK